MTEWVTVALGPCYLSDGLYAISLLSRLTINQRPLAFPLPNRLPLLADKDREEPTTAFLAGRPPAPPINCSK